MLPIVITVGRDGAGDHAELRYALRAIEANVPHEQVIIAGYKPAWANIEHIAVQQIPGDRHGNVRASIRAACKTLPEGFILWQDDIFAMRPIDEVPVTHGGPLAERIAKIEAADGSSGYTRALRSTLEWLEGNGYSNPLAYDGCHMPLLVEHPDVMRDALLVARDAKPIVLAVQTLYGNIASIGGRKAANTKAHTGFKTRTWVSTSDERFNTGQVGAFIRDTFPAPSQYEQ